MSSFADADPPVALGALDGRYRPVVAPLVDFLSEAALNRMRVRVEVEWLIHLTDHKVVPGVRHLTDDEKAALRRIVSEFGPAQVDELAAIERETVHDVKAVEYFLKRRLATIVPADEDRGLGELVHFACTSEDVNNLSYALLVKGAVQEVWLPRATAVVDQVADMAGELRGIPMLAHTHGQPATPTTLGKELAVLAARLRRQLRRVGDAEYLGKLNGATGTFGAHLAAVPDADWPGISRSFVEGLGLAWNPLTTQIESHDWQAELYADLARFNRVMHNLCTDVWTYISFGYFAQVRGQGTVGSSTMPHKVNPIRFENAEANLEVSNACSTCWRRRWCSRGCSGTSPTPRCSATSGRRSGTRCWRSTTSRAGCRDSTPCPRRWPPTSTRTGRCSGRRSSRRCARSRRRAYRGWTSPTSGSRS